MDEKEINILIEANIHATLIKMGLDSTKPLENQKDNIFVRNLRKNSETVSARVRTMIIGQIVSSMLMLLGLGTLYFFKSQ